MKRAYLAVVFVLLLVSMAAVSVLLVFWLSKPNIEYSIDLSSREFYPDQTNMVNINCINRSGTGSFYVVLNAINASFGVKENEVFSHLSNDSVWVPFSLVGGTCGSKSVAFMVDSSKTGFTFNLLLKESESSEAKWGLTPTSSVYYQWNESSKSYRLAAGSGVVA